MTTRSGDGEGPRTVRFGRRSSRGLILGLSGARVAALSCALLVALGALYSGGMRGLAWTAPLWGTAVLASAVKVSGRRAAEWVPVYGHWLVRRVRQQTRYLVRVMPARPAGTLALPGDAASLRIHHDEATGAAMIHDPHRQTLTAVARVRHPSFVLLSPADQDRRVAGWGRVYAACCQSARVARIQVLERTLPDSGQAQRQWWQEAGNPRSEWAAEQYAELIEAAGPAAERHETTISVSLDLAAARRAIRSEGGGTVGAAAVCWPLHPPLVEELSALRTAHRAAFAPDGPPTGPLDWHHSLAAVRGRLHDYVARTGCRLDSHRAGTPASWTDTPRHAAHLENAVAADVGERGSPQS